MCETNKLFNFELQMQIEGILPKGHIYQLGKPGLILRSAGFPDLPIELSASHTLIDQQRRTLADVEYLDLDSAAKIIKKFINPSLLEEKISKTKK